MAPVIYTVVVLFLFALSRAGQAQAQAQAAPSTDVYERLETYGFPEGLLPHIVTGYALEENGRFTLYLEQKCRVLIQGKYPLVYEKVITGLLSYGQLQELKGITVKAYYIWWNITGISVSGELDQLFFEIGILSAKFPRENFDDPPICEIRSVESSFLDAFSDQ